MAHILDPLQSAFFLLGADGVNVQRFEVAVDELDRLEQPTWSFALPDFAESAATQGLE